MFLIEKTSPFPSFSPFRSSVKPPPPPHFDRIFRTFDENLIRRLKNLTLTSSSISLNWLSLAVDLLSSTHAEAHAVISKITSASGDSRSFYLDHSVKLLDVSNSISAEIDKLRHRKLLMKFVLHLLHFPHNGDVPAPEKVRKASECLLNWETNSRGFSNRKGFQLRQPDVLIRDLSTAIASISPPRGKFSAVERAILRTIYAVGLISVFVAGVTLSALYGLPEITRIRVPSEFLWADSVSDLQSAIFDGGKKIVLSEIDDMATRAYLLREIIDGGVTVAGNKERLKSAVREMETITENLSEGLDRLGDGVSGMFRVVLSTRNGVLDNCRLGPPEKERM